MIAIQWKYLFMQLYIHFLRWHGTVEVNYSTIIDMAMTLYIHFKRLHL